MDIQNRVKITRLNFNAKLYILNWQNIATCAEKWKFLPLTFMKFFYFDHVLLVAIFGLVFFMILYD